MSNAAATMIRAEGLTKVYGERHVALNAINLEVERGCVLGVLGANGAGKTTLVRLLLGLHVPTAGRVWVLGQRMTPNAAHLRRRMGYLPADPRFPPGMTAMDYLDFVGRLGGMPRASRRPKVAALLRAVELQRYAGLTLEQLSTGLRARAAIAASLINDPDLLVWDEPSQGLDPEARQSMLELIQELAVRKSILICSHFLQELRQVCTRAIVLHEGQIIHDGALDELHVDAKPSVIELSLVGDRKEIAESVKLMQAIDELESSKLQRNQLRLCLKPGASRAAALASVLSTLADHKLDVTELRAAGEPTERLLSKLTREEGSRGFARAYHAADH